MSIFFPEKGNVGRIPEDNDSISIESHARKDVNEVEATAASSVQNLADEGNDMVEDLLKQILESEKYINSLLDKEKDLKTTINDLEKLINSLPDTDPKKQAAIKDLNTAKEALVRLSKAITTAQAQLSEIQNDMGNLQGSIDELRRLSSLTNPTQGDLDKAAQHMKIIQAIQQKEGKDLQNILSIANKELVAVRAAIQGIQDKLDYLNHIPDIIQEKYVEFKKNLEVLLKQLVKNQESLDQALAQQKNLKTIISNLEEQIQSLSDGDPQKAIAQKKLDIAKENLAGLSTAITRAESQLADLKKDIETLQGTINELQRLASLDNPTVEDLAKFDQLMKIVQTLQDKEKSGFQNSINTANREISNINHSIQGIKGDLSGITDSIKGGYEKALLIANLIKKLMEYQENLDLLIEKEKKLKTTIADLKNQINVLPDNDPRKIKAQQDLDNANEALASLNKAIATAQTLYLDLQDDIERFQGALDELNRLSLLQYPKQGDLDKANQLIKELGTIPDMDEQRKRLQMILSVADTELSSLDEIIKTIHKDLNF